MSDQNESAPTIEDRLQAIADRVKALEEALASLGDAVSPGGVSTLKDYHDWRKDVEAR